MSALESLAANIDLCLTESCGGVSQLATCKQFVPRALTRLRSLPFVPPAPPAIGTDKPTEGELQAWADAWKIKSRANAGYQAATADYDSHTLRLVGGLYTQIPKTDGSWHTEAEGIEAARALLDQVRLRDLPLVAMACTELDAVPAAA